MHFAPIAILPCQELAIRYAKQVIDVKISAALLWETRNQKKIREEEKRGRERDTNTETEYLADSSYLITLASWLCSVSVWL